MNTLRRPTLSLHQPERAIAIRVGTKATRGEGDDRALGVREREADVVREHVQLVGTDDEVAEDEQDRAANAQAKSG